MQEIWRDIVGYEGLYQVSNLGNVKLLKRTFSPNGGTRVIENKIMKNYINRDGYIKVQLTNNGKQKTISIHRLVAQSFVKNEFEYNEVNHIDGDKSNNNIENLEWSNRSQNIKHAILNNLFSVRKRGNHNMAKIVINLNNGIFYDCIIDASDSINMSYSKLRNRLNGIVFNNTSLRYA